MKHSELFDLSGRVALVTGGATGIGFSIAAGFAKAGASVVIASRNAEQLKNAVADIIKETGNDSVNFCVRDLADRAAAQMLVPDIIDQFGRLDILVGNAGLDILEPISHFANDSIDKLLEVNLTSNIVLARSAIPELAKYGCGRMIFVSSIAATTGSDIGASVYAASKSGLHAFARTVAFEVGEQGITVNCIAPGFTMTAIMDNYLQSFGEAGNEEREKAAQTSALKRWGKPDDMVGPALLLASDAGSYITGSVIVVDGGTSIRLK